MAARTFTLVEIKGTDGCSHSTIKLKGETGHYTGTPERAAKKAFSQLNRQKAIKGSVIITVRETTQGSAKAVHSYRLQRVKLTKPIKLGTHTIEYGDECKSLRGKVPTCRRKSGSSANKKTKKAKRS